MVRSLKSQPSRTFESSRLAVSSSSSNRGGQDEGSFNASSAEKTRWEMRLSLAQLGVLWSVIGGTMIMVFLFGLYAGREQGVKSALEGQQGEAVRLPVASPVAVQEIPGQIGADAVAAGPVELAALPSQASSGQPSAGQPPAKEAPAAAERSASERVPPESLLAEPPSREGAAILNPSSLNGGSQNGGSQNTDAPTTLADKEIAKKEKEKERAAAKDAALKDAAAKDVAAKDVAAKDVAVKDAAAKDAAKAKELAKAEAVKSDAVKTVKGSLTPGWYLQVSAARNSSEAANVAKKLKSAGLKPVIETAQVNKSTYYRVVLGPYSSKEAASTARKAAMSSNAAKGEPFLKQVK